MDATTPDLPEKPGYVLEYEDSFEGDALDLAKWTPYMMPHWAGRKNSAARYELANGILRLKIEKDQLPWFPGRDDDNRASHIQTGHYAGPLGSGIGQLKFADDLTVIDELSSARHYAPLYGYFEIRLKALPIEGYHAALWMVAYDETEGGEIRWFELHGGQMTANRSRIDYGILPWRDPALNEELYETPLPFNAADFHVYGLEWTPEHVDFFLDGKLISRIDQSPSYPMQFMLGLYERPHELAANDPMDDFPRSIEVDYFRGYRPIGGYGER